MEKNLIYISGKKKSIGTPNIYNVTEDFYSYLNIDKEENLPGYEEFRKINLLTQKSAVSEDEPEVPEVKVGDSCEGCHMPMFQPRTCKDGSVSKFR